MKQPLLAISLLLFTLLTFPSCKSKDYIFHIRENTPSFFQNYDTTIVVLPLGEIVKHNISINKRSFDASKANESDFIPVSGALQEKISQLDVKTPYFPYTKSLLKLTRRACSYLPIEYVPDSALYFVGKLAVHPNFDSYLFLQREEINGSTEIIPPLREIALDYYLINVKNDTLLSIVDISFNNENCVVQKRRITKKITLNLFKSTYESSCSEDDGLIDFSGSDNRQDEKGQEW